MITTTHESRYSLWQHTATERVRPGLEPSLWDLGQVMNLTKPQASHLQNGHAAAMPGLASQYCCEDEQ